MRKCYFAGQLSVLSKRLFSNPAAQPQHDVVGRNYFGIPMIPDELFRKMFNSDVISNFDPDRLSSITNVLAGFDLGSDESTGVYYDLSILDSISKLEIPDFLGCSLDEHFRAIALTQTEQYTSALETLMNTTFQLSDLPPTWRIEDGWVRYGFDGSVGKVGGVCEQAYVFDIESCVQDGPHPVFACALSDSAFYTWISTHLYEGRPFRSRQVDYSQQALQIDSLIPMNAGNSEKLIIGHNVSFDRARIREEYRFESSKVRFLDTMSLHIAVCGMTTDQRHLYKHLFSKNAGVKTPKGIKKTLDRHKRLAGGNFMQPWTEHTSLNSLFDVYNHHCRDNVMKLDKTKGDLLRTGTFDEIRTSLPNLITYCATDVLSTFYVTQQLWPKFKERFPHPVTFAGMLEMSISKLPVNQNWPKYLQRSESALQSCTNEISYILVKLAHSAVEKIYNEEYKNDIWLWNLDWSTQMENSLNHTLSLERTNSDVFEYELAYRAAFVEKFPHRKAPESLLTFPRWFIQLCPNKIENSQLEGKSVLVTKLTAAMRIAPTLLCLSWCNAPLHYETKLGWGFLVKLSEKQAKEMPENDSPHDSSSTPVENQDPAHWQHFPHWNLRTTEDDLKKTTTLAVRCHSVNISNSIFYKMPHSNGIGLNVGNPLSRDMLKFVESGILTSLVPEHADRIVRNNREMSYWMLNRDRIMQQLVGWTQLSTEDDDQRTGIILPQLVTAGTVTRRAVERTWLTASNVRSDRIGSELKAMIQAPDKMCFVGADVDSQELWIASCLADSSVDLKLPGSTPISWMTLRGDKALGTDQHSVTAKSIGISRESAKVLNYARIYGAGVAFAKQLLMLFDPLLSSNQAFLKAKQLYAKTKGEPVFRVRMSEIEKFQSYAKSVVQELERVDKLEDLFGGKKSPKNLYFKTPAGDLVVENRLIAKLCKGKGQSSHDFGSAAFYGGTESELFTKLEEIASSHNCKTPVLDAVISKALDTDGNRFIGSKINWVVQSSAVDYLHLMLCCMRWLCDQYDINARFTISIHDEVRYLVDEDDKYRAALALQLTNLYVRSMFTEKIGLKHLPLSVAFFSQVDIDKCLRKEINLDCVTPSNPNGLHAEYGIPFAEALTFEDVIRKTGGVLSKS